MSPDEYLYLIESNAVVKSHLWLAGVPWRYSLELNTAKWHIKFL